MLKKPPATLSRQALHHAAHRPQQPADQKVCGGGDEQGEAEEVAEDEDEGEADGLGESVGVGEAPG